MTRNWTAGEWWEWVRLEYRSGDRIGIITKIQKKTKLKGICSSLSKCCTTLESTNRITVTNAFAVEFEVLRSWVVPSSLLRFHFQRRSLSCRSKLIQVARWPSGLPPRFGCPLSIRRSAMAKRKSGGCRFSKFFVWATCQNLFPVTSKQPVTVTYSYEMEYEFLRSFCPTWARRCHFCMGICDLDRIFD